MGRHRLGGDELLDEHPIQGEDWARLARCSMRHRVGLLPSSRSPDRRLHQRIAAQGRVVIQVLVAAAQPVQPLRHQIAQVVSDQIGMARVMQCAATEADNPMRRSTSLAASTRGRS